MSDDNDEMKEILTDFLTETTEMIDDLDQKFVELETQPNNTALLNEIFRAMHSMKGSAGFLGFTHLVDVTHRAESILNKLRQGEMAVVPAVITVILETVDTVKLIMADIRSSGTDANVPVEVSLAVSSFQFGGALGPSTGSSVLIEGGSYFWERYLDLSPSGVVPLDVLVVAPTGSRPQAVFFLE